MAPNAPNVQELGSKERSLFGQVVKSYENKQYKKGLKAAEQVLRKNPQHGDTIAMKALIINSQGNSGEGFLLAKEAIKFNMKSHICWHVYGLLWRSVKNFDEAIKAYKFALKMAPESSQIQKDLALLQMQMRDYAGFEQSRRAMLQTKTMLRQNWTALAVAQHLNGNLGDAERTLTTYEDIIKSPPPKTDIEHHEAILYKNMIIYETGEVERALEHLVAATKINPDRGSVMELKAKYLLELGRKEEAAEAYRKLLDRNAEYRDYYEGLTAAQEIEASDKKALKRLYDEYVEKNPRGDAARRLPLGFLEGDDFQQATDKYLRRMLHKGVPSTFANVKGLYTDTAKRTAVEELVEGYVAGEGVSQMNGSVEKKGKEEDYFEPSVRYFLAQHYNYHLSRNLTKAMKYIDEAIESNPKFVDYHMTKARIWKHYGNFQKAAETMEQARALDERDRYINTKAAKYQLRNLDNEAAIKNMAKFTRNEATGGPLGDLHDMQCQWFIYEDGKAYLHKKKLSLALKRFTTIYNIFDIWQEDQFDFHSFSLRKGQIRAYIEMIRWENALREHPFFTRAAIAAARIYVMLNDDPTLTHGNMANGVNGEAMNAADRKKAQKKARKEAEKQAQKVAERKDAKKTAGVDQNGEPKKLDSDPNGEKLLQTTEPLVEAMKFVNPLLEYSPKNIEAQQIAFEVFLRRKKYALALRTLLTQHALSPSNPTLHYQSTVFRHTLAQLSEPLPDKISQIIDAEFSPHLPPTVDLYKHNEDFLQRHHDSVAHVHAALQTRQILKPETKDENCKDVIRTLALDDGALADADRGLRLLSEWKADKKYRDDYKDAAGARWPECSRFSEM